jgi:hypothetical protein
VLQVLKMLNQWLSAEDGPALLPPEMPVAADPVSIRRAHQANDRAALGLALTSGQAMSDETQIQQPMSDMLRKMDRAHDAVDQSVLGLTCVVHHRSEWRDDRRGASLRRSNQRLAGIAGAQLTSTPSMKLNPPGPRAPALTRAPAPHLPLIVAAGRLTSKRNELLGDNSGPRSTPVRRNRLRTFHHAFPAVAAFVSSPKPING